MSESKDADIIIAGSGLAGSTLLRQLLSNPSTADLSIIVLDKSLEIKNDRTWCFWSKPDEFTAPLVSKSWNTLQFGFVDGVDEHQLTNYSYYSLRSSDYLHACRQFAQDRSNVRFIETDVSNFLHDKPFAVVETSNGVYRAPLIVQSCLKAGRDLTYSAKYVLKQHFLGIEIETESDIFDPEKAMFMDFRTDQTHGFAFMYVLPFSKRHALIEYTIFSEDVIERPVYESVIDVYIKTVLGLNASEWRKTREEYGVIPMEDIVYKDWWCKGVLNLGQAGGQSKASTGYTFTRIQRYVLEVADTISNRNMQSLDRNAIRRFRKYDRLILWMLLKKPNQVISVFRQLFDKNGADTILKFLDENTTFREELSIFSTTQWRYFFEAIARSTIKRKIRR